MSKIEKSVEILGAAARKTGWALREGADRVYDLIAGTPGKAAVFIGGAYGILTAVSVVVAMSSAKEIAALEDSIDDYGLRQVSKIKSQGDCAYSDPNSSVAITFLSSAADRHIVTEQLRLMMPFVDMEVRKDTVALMPHFRVAACEALNPETRLTKPELERQIVDIKEAAKVDDGFREIRENLKSRNVTGLMKRSVVPSAP